MKKNFIFFAVTAMAVLFSNTYAQSDEWRIHQVENDALLDRAGSQMLYYNDSKWGMFVISEEDGKLDVGFISEYILDAKDHMIKTIIGFYDRNDNLVFKDSYYLYVADDYRKGFYLSSSKKILSKIKKYMHDDEESYMRMVVETYRHGYADITMWQNDVFRKFIFNE